jgi:hypothetical protein
MLCYYLFDFKKLEMANKKELKHAHGKKPSGGSSSKNRLPAKPAVKTRKKKDPELTKEQIARKLVKIKTGLEKREIVTFKDIFDIMAPSTFGKAIGIQTKSFNDRVLDPGKFTLNRLIVFSNRLQVGFDAVNDFITGLLTKPERVTEEEYKVKYPKS